MTYDENAIDTQRLLKDSYGRLLVSESTAYAFESCNGDFSEFLALCQSGGGNLNDEPDGVSTTNISNTGDSISSDVSAAAEALFSAMSAVTNTISDANVYYVPIENRESNSRVSTRTHNPSSGPSGRVRSNNNGVTITTTRDNTGGSSNTSSRRPTTGNRRPTTTNNSSTNDGSSTTGDRTRRESDETYTLNSAATTTLNAGQMSAGLGLVSQKLKIVTDLAANSSLTGYAAEQQSSLASFMSEFGSGSGSINSDRVCSVNHFLSVLKSNVCSLLGIENDSTPRARGTEGREKSTEQTNPTNSAETAYYRNIFNAMQSGGYVTAKDNQLNSEDWLYNQLNNGNLYLHKYVGDKDDDSNPEDGFEMVSWSSGDSSVVVKTDDEAIAKAEARYEATMADIEVKDKQFDLQLKNVDTEHAAVQTEMDSVKKVIDGNIEKTFKMFQA